MGRRTKAKIVFLTLMLPFFRALSLSLYCRPAIAVAGNSLVLAAIWKRSFQRSPFHVLLSGMVVTDLCTGLIAQPFIVATNLLYLTKPIFVIKQLGLFLAIKTTGDASATYSIAFNNHICWAMAAYDSPILGDIPSRTIYRRNLFSSSNSSSCVSFHGNS